MRDWKLLPDHLKKTCDGVHHVLSCGRYVEVQILRGCPRLNRFLMA